MTIDTKTLRLAAQAYANVNQDATRQLLADAADTIDALTRRLEITDDAPGWDGIACRDETIRSQERVIDDMKAEIARLREALEKVRPVVAADRQSLLETHGNGIEIPATDELGTLGMYEYDGALHAIDAALAQEQS